MSRTDKTRPWYVRALDAPTYLEPRHDHRHGPCDLPPRPAPGTADGAGGWVRPATACTWTGTTLFWALPQHHCGCPFCSGSDWRSIDTRATRRTVKASLRQCTGSPERAEVWQSPDPRCSF